MSTLSDIGHAISKGVKDIGNEVARDAKKITGNEKADPRKFSSTQTTMPTNTNSPITTPPVSGIPTSAFGATPLPIGGVSMGGTTSPFTASQQAQIQSGLSAAGIWDTIKGLGGDVWGAIAGVLPKNADGGIDWGKVGSDVAGWVKNNASTILSAASAIDQYNRQQKSDEYAQDALKGIPGTSYKGMLKEFEDKAPLRDAGQAGMLNPSANMPDLSGLRNLAGAGSGNPFARSMSAPAAPLPMAPSMPPAGPPMSATMPGGTPGLPSSTPQPLPLQPPPASGPIPRPPQAAASRALALPLAPSSPTAPARPAISSPGQSLPFAPFRQPTTPGMV